MDSKRVKIVSLCAVPPALTAEFRGRAEVPTQIQDRALPSEGKGQRFESPRARQ
jgi:hypothetical protein